MDEVERKSVMLDILYEDKDILVVVKPAGVVLSYFIVLLYQLPYGLFQRIKNRKVKLYLLMHVIWAIWLIVNIEILLMMIFND